MSPSLLCVQFRNMLPSEEILLFARTLWGAAQRDGLGVFQAGDATLSITKTSSNTAPFEASLAFGAGSLQSIASGLEPLSVIEAAFAQLSSRRSEAPALEAALLGESATADVPASQGDTARA